jgi:hypothetical protein
MQDTVWVTKDGQQLLVSQMETSHVRNCIAKIERSRKNWRRSYLSRLKLELVIREIRQQE